MREQKGFSLLELLLVMGVLALTLTVSLGIVGSEKSSVRRAAALVKTAFVGARQRAIADGYPVFVDIDLLRRTIRVPGEPEAPLVGVDRIRVTTRRQDLVGVDEARLGFFRDGSSTGGQIDLMQGATVASIAVYWLNGRIEVREKEGRR